MKTTLYLIRHGRTDWNDQGRLQGRSNIPLNTQGIIEAETLAEVLKDIPFKAIYTSPLQRAAITAEYIAEKHVLKPIEEAAFAEASFGDFEGYTWAEVYAHPLILKAQPERDIFHETTGGRESYSQTYIRASQALDTIVSHHAGDTIAVVSHGLVLKTLAYHAGVIDKDAIEQFVIHNARPYILDYYNKEKRYISIDFPIEWRK